MARRASLATGTSAIKYTITKNEKVIKKQEIKNLKTICISENCECHWQGDSISFFLVTYAQLHNSKFIVRKNGRRCKATMKVRIRVCADLNKKVENVSMGNKKRKYEKRAWSASVGPGRRFTMTLPSGVQRSPSATGYVGYWWNYARLWLSIFYYSLCHIVLFRIFEMTVLLPYFFIP